jgi:predicted nucleic acid-binding protein
MKLRVYLDTSVFSAYHDTRTPERLAETREFWDRIAEFEVSSSDITRTEIESTVDPDRRDMMLRMLPSVLLHPITEEMHGLAHAYVDRGLFTPTMYNDALHVAAAVLARNDILVSWNFKHLVNRRQRAQISDVNVLLRLPTIEILAPSEV